MDSKTQALLQDIHPTLASQFYELDARFRQATADSLEIEQGVRSWASQAAIYAKGRTAKSDVSCVHDGVRRLVGTCEEHPLGATVTNAQAGYSQHEFGLAIDACPQSLLMVSNWAPADHKWAVMVDIAGTLGFVCGACWHHPDIPHLQMT